MDRVFTCRNPANESISHIVFPGIGYLFFGLALLNLTFLRPLEMVPTLASVAWICFILYSTISNCRTIGIRQHCIDLLGGCVRNRFVRVEENAPGQAAIAYGFVFGARRFFQLKFRPDGIRTIDWNMGQASGLAGKDVDDWRVAVWCDPASIVYNQNGNKHGICVVGPRGSQEEIDDFGRGLIEFLRGNSIDLPSPTEGLHGSTGIVIEDGYPIARIRIGDEEFMGHADEAYIKKLDRVYVSDVRGTTVYVKKEKPEQAAGHQHLTRPESKAP